MATIIWFDSIQVDSDTKTNIQTFTYTQLIFTHNHSPRKVESKGENCGQIILTPAKEMAKRNVYGQINPQIKME